MKYLQEFGYKVIPVNPSSKGKEIYGETIVASLEEINIPIDKCVYIGDRLDFDAIGSSDAGMLGVWLNRKNITDKKIPKKVKMIPSWQQLTPLLI